MILVFRIGIVLFRGFDFLNWHVAFLYGLPERKKAPVLTSTMDVRAVSQNLVLVFDVDGNLAKVTHAR